MEKGTERSTEMWREKRHGKNKLTTSANRTHSVIPLIKISSGSRTVSWDQIMTNSKGAVVSFQKSTSFNPSLVRKAVKTSVLSGLVRMSAIMSLVLMYAFSNVVILNMDVLSLAMMLRIFDQVQRPLIITEEFDR